MAYATIQEFKDRIDDQVVLQLTTRDGQTADDAAIQQALDDAAAVIDGYLERISTADRPSAAVLRPYAVDIAVYRLARNRPGQEFESIQAAYEAAVKFLSRVAEGRFPGAGTSESPTGGAAVHYAPPRTFSSDAMGDF